MNCFKTFRRITSKELRFFVFVFTTTLTKKFEKSDSGLDLTTGTWNGNHTLTNLNEGYSTYIKNCRLAKSINACGSYLLISTANSAMMGRISCGDLKVSPTDVNGFSIFLFPALI